MVARRLVKRGYWPYTYCVHKNRLGARPPRKRSAPVAGKRIRNDETPPQAGFRILGPLSAASGRRGFRGRSAEHMPQQGMEVDAALPRRRFIPVEYVRRLHHQLHRVWPYCFKPTHFKEGGVPLTVCRLYRDVHNSAVHATPNSNSVTACKLYSRRENWSEEDAFREQTNMLQVACSAPSICAVPAVSVGIHVR
jgi:hypothetical protein